MKKFRYTIQHIEFLRTGYLSMKVQDLTRAFNDQFGMSKTEGLIKSALANHKIRCGRKHKDRLITRRRMLTKDQDRFVRDNYRARGVKELTLLLNDRFQINLTSEQIKTYVTNHNIKSGRTGCFPKGHIPANRKPLWTERICSKDGYILMKVPERDPYTGFPTRYKQKHVYIWE